LQGAHDGECVAHGVQQMHAVGGAERVGAGDPGDGWSGADCQVGGAAMGQIAPVGDFPET
jgi:hypothetical protein